MVAIISVDGVQRVVQPDDTLEVRGMLAEPGSTVSFDEVLLVGEEEAVQVGRPVLAGVKVVCEVLRHGKSRKLTVFKFRRRSNYRRRTGYREERTWLKVKVVEVPGHGA